MLKKILILILLSLSLLSFSEVSFAEAPLVNCTWLPWCADKNKSNPIPVTDINNSNLIIKLTGWLISELIKFTSVFWVIWIIISWLMLIFSGWNEEKMIQARKYIFWSMTWTMLSSTAYLIISVLNKITIN